MSCYCHSHGVDVSASSVSTELPIQSGDEVCVIFGSRAYASQPGSVKVRAGRVLDEFLQRGLPKPDVVVSGGADGADEVAEAVALKLGVPMVVFSVGTPSEATEFRRGMADEPWVVETVTTYGGPEDDPSSGRGAYLTRNCMMASLVGAHDGSAFAIHNGSSQGTQHMLDSCRSHGVEPTVTYRFDQ